MRPVYKTVASSPTRVSDGVLLMSGTSLSEAICAIKADAWSGVIIFLVAIAVFVFVGFAVFALLYKGGKRSSVRDALEYVFPPHTFGHAQSRLDLMMTILNRVVWNPIFAVLGLLTAGLSVNKILVSAFGAHAPLLHSSGVILASQVIVSYLSTELAFYITHRLLHTNRFLWMMHRAHHSAEALTFLTNGRAHPLDIAAFFIGRTVISGLALGVLLCFTGTDMHPTLPAALFVIALIGGIMDNINHSHLPVSYGLLDYVLVSGRVHQIHHSAELVHRDKNFGGTTSFFDWLFGTLYIPRSDESFRLGLSEEEIGDRNPHKSLLDVYLEPFRYVRRVMRDNSN